MVTPPRPRLLRLITRLNIGGPARQALLLSAGLASEYDTTLAAGTPDTDEGELHHPAVSLRRLPLVRPVRPVVDAQALVAIRRLMQRERPAIVHSHMAKAGALGRVAAMSVQPRPRTVHTFHGHVLEGYFGRSTQRAFVEMERCLARRTDALVAVSAEVREDLLDLGIGRPDQFHMLALGLELTPFLAVSGASGKLRRHLGLRSDAALVGIVGRLVPIKDHVTLLTAMEHLPGVHLAVIGDGELRRQLELHTRQAGLADRVHFTGWRHDMPGVLSDLDVVALTSRNEGTPVALIEAGAAGRAVVATDVGGVRSVVEEGVNGLLAPPGDFQRVALLLRHLLNDPRRREHMGESGRSRARERFGEGRLLQDIRSLYSDLVPRPGGAANNGSRR
ncbi:MAG: glycosyltransferase [Acidimicrobiales bacterium]